MLTNEGTTLIYTYDKQREGTDVTQLLDAVEAAGLRFRDLDTRQNSLEEIFVNLVNDR